ncbi:MAG: hypothetical protein HRU09_12290 [Oligoflexales bacterium]|nr:hypothetical protein [Oligoflexales bacterium]
MSLKNALLLLFVSIPILALMGSCDDDEEKFELVNKLRAVGIKADKPIVTGVDTVNLEIVALLPAGKTIDTVEPFVDDTVSSFLRLTINLQDGETYTEKGALTVYSKTATVDTSAIPGELLEQLNGVAKLRYGVRLVSEGEEEIIVGDILSVVADDEALQWTAPSLSVEAPGDTEAIGQPFTLKSQIEKPQDERIKSLWFISSGTVKNSQALETEWTEAATGDQTVLIAIFPQKSRFFDYQALQVTVQ